MVPRIGRELGRSRTTDAATYDMNPEQSGGQTDPVLTVKSTSEDPLDALQPPAPAITDPTSALRAAVSAPRALRIARLRTSLHAR